MQGPGLELSYQEKLEIFGPGIALRRGIRNFGAEKVSFGDILVGGKGVGWGHDHDHAVMALKAIRDCGYRAVREYAPKLSAQLHSSRFAIDRNR